MLNSGDRVQITKPGSEHAGYHGTVEEKKPNGMWLINIDGVGYRQYNEVNLVLLSNLSRAKVGLVKAQVVSPNDVVVRDIQRRLKAIAEEIDTVNKLVASIK